MNVIYNMMLKWYLTPILRRDIGFLSMTDRILKMAQSFCSIKYTIVFVLSAIYLRSVLAAGVVSLQKLTSFCLLLFIVRSIKAAAELSK